MRLLRVFKKEDFGVEYHLNALEGANRSLLQASVGFDDYPSTPYIIVYVGLNGLFEISVVGWRIGLSLSILGSNWCMMEEEQEYYQ